MSAPLLHLPGQAFTIWTRPPHHSGAASHGPIISLPGKQFTIWTRSVAKAPLVTSPAVAAAVATTPADQAAQAQTFSAGKTWLSRLAWLAVPFLGALWYSDHQRQNKLTAELTQNHLVDEALKTKFQDQSSSLSQERASLASQLEAAESKHRELALELSRMKASLDSMKAILVGKTLEAQSASDKADALKQEVNALKSGFGDKESAWNNSLAVLKADASKARQTLEQRELEMKDQIAKVEAERAAAQKEAAAAAATLAERTSQLETLLKKLPALPAIP